MDCDCLVIHIFNDLIDIYIFFIMVALLEHIPENVILNIIVHFICVSFIYQVYHLAYI